MTRRRRPILRALRTLPDRWHRPLAQALFQACGWAMKVRTYQRYYVVGATDDPTGLVHGGWHWSSCSLSTTVLELAMQLDWEHWDCWALVHDRCDPKPCDVCGGCRCLLDWDDDEDDAVPDAVRLPR